MRNLTDRHYWHNLEDGPLRCTGTLEEAINRLKEGWNFHNGSKVSTIGRALEKTFAGEDDLGTTVEVEFLSGGVGSGPGFYYTYEWKILGVTLPEDFAMETAFGSYAQYAPRITPIAGGFSCYYTR